MLTDKFLQHHEHDEQKLPDEKLQDKQKLQNKSVFACGCCAVIIINFAAFLFLYYWRGA
jgi:hypothetical protein